MTVTDPIQIEHLGQTGLKINLGELTVLVDPYLSHSVEELEAPDLIRQVPIAYEPESLTDVNWVLITHEHMDHCDPHTLPILANKNPECRFMGPLAVREQLYKWGINEDRILASTDVDINLGNALFVRSIAAAHPTIRRDQHGNPQAVGYIFRYKERILYAAGDTSVCEEIIKILCNLPQIDIALLPVNEDNYFRRQRGIIGNMSVREAFELARTVKIKQVIPVHWDMFKCNSTSQEEILAIYNSDIWPFSLGSIDSIKL